MYGTYDDVLWGHLGNIDALASSDIALEVAAGDTSFIWTTYVPCRVKYFGFLVTVAFDYDTQTTEGIVALDKRVTPLSDTGRVEVCRIDLEDAMAVGDVRFVKPPNTNADMEPGDQLVVEVVTQAVGGTEVGDWVPFVVFYPRAEVPANIASWTESVSGTDVTQVV
jgi:hypothetical protein